MDMFDILKKFSGKLNENFHRRMLAVNPLHDTRGIISIIGIAIFALLMIFGLMLQQTVVDTYQSVKGMNNYYIARDISDSTMEYLQYKLNNYEPGYNEEVECVYADGSLESYTPTDSGTESECRSMEGIIQGENVVINWVVKGRADDNEKLAIGTTTNCGANASDKINSNSCYVVPFPGTGSAGKHCDLYYPDFFDDADGDGDFSTSVGAFLTGGEPVDQLDYSCNWNKLMFGGSQMDRVSIPFYYDDDGDETMVNTFTTTGGGNRFYLRMRTPCLPCVYDPEEDVVSGVNRFCNRGEDPTVCGVGERYVLDAEEDNIVVQWQLTGQCGGEECGLVAIPEYDAYSAIFEGHINSETDRNRILHKGTEGYKTEVHGIEPTTFSEALSRMTTPTLTLFLNSALISDEGKNIPYLEYQILTNKPIGNPKTKMEVIANVDGNVFWKILYKEEAKGLIDFAVQN